MIGAFFSLVGLAIVAICYLYGAFYIGAFVSLAFLLVSISKYYNSKKLKPTAMICPNCNSNNIRISNEVTGLSNNGSSTFFSGWSFHSGNINVNRQHVGCCQDCGFDYPYYTEADIKQIQKKAMDNMAIWVAITAIVIIFGIQLYTGVKVF